MRPFQRETLKVVYAIPYGEIRTYAEIAFHIDRPHAYRAVGRANATNHMPIVIPCHRVIGANRNLVGFAGGVDIKEYLLQMELWKVGLED